MDKAWAGLQEAMQAGEAALCAAAPDEETKAEGLAYLARLFSACLDRALSPEERTVGGLYYGGTKIGGANPDYTMAQAELDPNGQYRLSGRVNEADRIGIGIYTAKPGAGLDLDGYATLDNLDLDGEGRFSLTLARGLNGRNELALKDTTNVLMTREMHLRPGERRAEIALTRLDRPAAAASNLPLARAALEAKLAMAGGQALALLRQFLRWSEVFAMQPNTMTQMAEELDRAVRGDPETRYYSGYYDLGPNDGLLIEWPGTPCAYTAIQALNHWLEPIPHSSFNHATAAREADGKVRVVVAHRDPGAQNWLDTGGRRRGCLLYRTVGASTIAVPNVQLISLPR